LFPEEIAVQTLVEENFNQRILAVPDRILVATDFTDMDYLMPHIVFQAKKSGAEVTLVHATLPSDLISVEATGVPYNNSWKIDRDVRMALLEIARKLQSNGIACESRAQHGNAREVILSELHRIKATRLILGSHGRGKLGQLVLGSVAHELLSHVDIPTFVVGPHARNASQHVTPRKILHPVSLVGDYKRSFRLALDIAQAYNAELTLLHVLDRHLEESINPQRTIEWATHALEALIPNATDLVPRILTQVTSGKLTTEILEQANRIGSDWIVLGSNGSFHPWSLKETAAYQVLVAANCPVLMLRHEPYRSNARNLEEVHFTLPA
jgi:nucleotide-binding universal stress UspA family protein